MTDEILARVHASLPRRVFGVGMLLIFGGMLLYTALASPPANPAWRIFLVGAGLSGLFLADKMRRATANVLELTETELRCSDGTRLAGTEEIEALNRDLFAFKPSNGFTLRLNRKVPATWQPGLWWGFGHRIGVGGATSAFQTRAMAEILSAMLARRHMNDT